MIQQIRKFAYYLASLEIWVVGLLVAASFVSQRVLPLAVGIIAAYWPVRWLGNGRLSIRTPADWPIAMLVLTIPVTLWATALPGTTLPQVYRLLAGIGLYFALVNWADSRVRLRWLVRGLVGGGIILALFALVSVQWTTGKLPFIPASIYRLFPLLVSDPVHRNVMAGSLVILLPLVLTLFLFDWRSLHWVDRAVFSLGVVIMAGILLLTQSRGGVMAFGAVIFVLPLLRWRYGWIVCLVGVLALVVIVQASGSTHILDILLSNDTLGSLNGRMEVWSRAIYMIQDFPFTGIGMGTFTPVADALYPFFLAEPGSISHAHNLFLQVGVDLGIPGLLAWLAIWMLVLVTAWQVYQHGRAIHDGWVMGLGAALCCSQLALVTHGLLDAVTWGMVKPAPIVWALWGLTMASGRVCISRVIKTRSSFDGKAFDLN